MGFLCENVMSTISTWHVISDSWGDSRERVCYYRKLMVVSQCKAVMKYVCKKKICWEIRVG